jgi:glycosyltransferase involved in cell wall biosynthesis
VASPERQRSSPLPIRPSVVGGREASTIRVLGIATQGAGSTDEARLRTMLREFDAEIIPFDRRARRRMLLEIARKIRSRKYEIVALEGTGVAGGLAVIIGRVTAGVPYVVSTGDAVAPFLRIVWPWSTPFAGVYERALYRLSGGVIGWTPYLVGRALTFGARRAMTAPGWAPFPRSREQLEAARREIRSKLRIPTDAIVFGIAGSLVWNDRVGYSYGLELVRAIGQVRRDDIVALIVGDGTAAARLRELAGDRQGKSVFMPGKVAQSAVPDYLAAVDVGSLPQSVDSIGSFRYTTKLSEYVAVGLPVVTGQTPLAYDFVGDWLWRLPGDAPWSSQYIGALAQLMESVTRKEIAEKRNRVGRLSHLFDQKEQVDRVTSFISELCAESAARGLKQKVPAV